MKLHAGDSTRPGAHHIDGGVNIVVASGSAESLELCLFDAAGRETHRLPFTHRSGDHWHGFLPGASAGLTYGLRAHGRFDPATGLFFEPSRLLVDPFARDLSGAYTQYTGHFPGDRIDTAPFTPKSVVRETKVRTSSRNPLKASPFIYEAHVRGLTRLHPELPESIRGTYAALGSAPVIRHLKRLGVEALELLPVQFHIDEPHLVARGLNNYWGYSPIGCMALHADYAADKTDPVGELAASIRALHGAGIEVILDVVFNHTAEGGADGPIVSMRGLDPHLWYLHNGHSGQLADFTGCGNTLNVTHPLVAQWILSTLRFWCETLDVDGFRFDLATTLGRQGEGFDASTGLLAQLAADPIIGQCRLIAEPWDIGPHGYRLGSFGGRFMEWNDRFRDSARVFWKGDPGAQAEFGRRLHGSSELFESSGRGPAAGINFITAHDGFCLTDVVSFNHKHNEANGEDNRDGSVHNHADNLGVEGWSEDPVLYARRQQRIRALLATLMLAEGTPMLLAGDELGHSLRGNNNAYCQDNALNWLDWSGPAPLIGFITHLSALRRQRLVNWPSTYVHTPFSPDDVHTASIAWYAANGQPMTAHHWHEDDCAFAMLRACDGRMELCAFNRSREPRVLQVPEPLVDRSWRIVLDTTMASGVPENAHCQHELTMDGQGVWLLECLSEGSGSP
jgi:glycogen operon protein